MYYIYIYIYMYIIIFMCVYIFIYNIYIYIYIIIYIIYLSWHRGLFVLINLFANEEISKRYSSRTKDVRLYLLKITSWHDDIKLVYHNISDISYHEIHTI